MSINWDEIKDYKPKRGFMYYIRRWVINPLSTAKYWLRTHTINRYHVIDIRNPEYDWGWIDADRQILYACFAILKTYIEDELAHSYGHGLILEIPEGEEENGYNWDDHIKRDTETKELYEWWTIHRPIAHKTFEDGKYDYHVSEQLYNKDTEMLKRLMDVRGSLWT